MSFSLFTPEEVAERVAARARALRLAQGWKRTTLAERSGVSASTIKRFESTGQITFDNLLKIALTLGCLDQFDALFVAPRVTTLAELEKRVDQERRMRGRR